jgi:DNA-binding NarL/FixJ family response regulator
MKDRASATGRTRRKRAGLRVVIADHFHLVRYALRCFLETFAHYDVVGEAADSGALLALVARAKPDIVLVEFELPPLNAPDVARVMVERAPGTPMVVLSRYETDGPLVQSLRNGAAAYVTKGAPARELPRAIEAAVKGDRYVSPPLSRRPVSYWLQRAQRGVVDAYETLGNRERQVLHLVAQGLSSTTISRRLGISARTVETHRERIKEKLGVPNHAGLIRYAVERQMLDLSERVRRL